MCVEAQLVFVACDDYEWLYVNGGYFASGHTIDKNMILNAINSFELDGSNASYEVEQSYVEECGGDLPNSFNEIPQKELKLLSASPKRKTSL